MRLTLRSTLLLTLAVFSLTSQAVHAERADRDKPINVESNTLTVDDDRHIQTLEGDVLLTQGTLNIRADKLVITEDRQGFQKGVATGGPKGKAYFRQKREGRTDFIEGEGDRIEYDTRSEVAELFKRAWVKSGHDLVKGDYIWYDSISEKYRANSAAPGEVTTSNNQPARVRAVIQPQTRNKQNPESQAETTTSLQSSNQLTKPE